MSRQYLQSIVDAPPKQGRRKKPEKVVAMVERAQRTDGICMLLTNAPGISKEEIARGYRTLSEVEQAFSEIKSFLRIRPVFHYADLRVRGHVFVCVLAYLLETFLEKKLREAHVPLSARKTLQILKTIHMVNGSFLGKYFGKTTTITLEQKEIYHALGIDDIPKTPAFSV